MKPHIAQAARYRINGPHVVAQVIDGEAILICFESGSYYSSVGVGGFIVEAIQRGLSVSAMVDALSGASTIPFTETERLVRAFLSELSGQGLIAESDRGGEQTEQAVMWSGGDVASPKLEKYSDLEDLLLLDPIHETSALGWPVAKPVP